MKTVRLTIEMVLEVTDEVAEKIQVAPGFVTFGGVTIGEEGMAVGYDGEDEVTPVDVEIRVELVEG